MDTRMVSEMYKINDYVSYGMQGVCQVCDIIERMTGDVSVSYYVLSPVYGNPVSVYVPIDNELLTSRIHPLLSAAQIQALADAVPELPNIWVPEDNHRKEAFKEILLSGERERVGALIKTLYQHRAAQKARGKKLHLTDERYLREAEKILFCEIALVMGKTFEQVAEEFAGMM